MNKGTGSDRAFETLVAANERVSNIFGLIACLVLVVIVSYTSDYLNHRIFNTVTAFATYFVPLLGSEESSSAPGIPIIQSNRQAPLRFKYTPLKGQSGFRLLELMPGLGLDPLICRLRHFDLSTLSLVRGRLHGLDSSSDTNPDIPLYEAISYVWGSCPVEELITCNGKPFKITTSLKRALCRMRQTEKNMYVWADAICIDQSNLQERKLQVDLMRTIYSKAKRVSICLGEQTDCSVEDLSVLKAVFRSAVSTRRPDFAEKKSPVIRNLHVALPAEDPYRSRNPNGYWTRPIRSLPSFISQRDSIVRVPTKTPRNPTLQRLAQPSWKLVADFFDDSWFRRIWVVQEVAESSKARVLIGDAEIQWHDIVEVAKTVLGDATYRAAVSRFAKTNGIHNVIFMNNKVSISPHDPIPILLQSTRDFEATDARDKVYAMLHRPIRKSRTYIDAEFRPGQEYLEVFAQSVSLLYFLSVVLDHTLTDIHLWTLLVALCTIAHFLQLHRSIRLLLVDYYNRFVSFLRKLDAVVSSSFYPMDTLYNMLGIRADYSLTTQSVYRMVATRTIQRTRKLNILSYANHGSTIDSAYPSWVPRWDRPTGGIEILTTFSDHKYRASADITHTIPISPKHADHLVVEGLQFSTLVSVTDLIPPTQATQLDDIPHTITSYDQLRTSEKYPTGESPRRAYMATLTAGRLGHLDSSEASYATSEFHFRFSSALRASYGRRLFVTENGYVGIGPTAMQRGDVACVLFGGCVPYILRATDTEGLWRVVGESYVHGVMRGEVIERWRAGAHTKERFTLC